MKVPQSLPQQLSECQTEEEVKNLFAKAFKFRLDTRRRMDLYTTKILFEFKYKQNFTKVRTRAYAIAQALYYVRVLRFGVNSDPVPPVICVVDSNEALFVRTAALKRFSEASPKAYDWDRAPSTPCPKLVRDLAEASEIRDLHVFTLGNPVDFEDFCQKLESYRQEQQAFDFKDSYKKVITEHTFQGAYESWHSLFGHYVENGRKAAEYFILDIQAGRTRLDETRGELTFQLSSNESATKPVPISEYEHYWSTYERVTDPKELHSIRQRMDRLSVEDFRRKTGEFFTPVQYAKKAIEYLEREIGQDWWKKGYRLWDMAAGTGNLEYELPEEALPFTYISTLLDDDAKYCADLYPTATVFQYDFLNDDVLDRLGGEMSFADRKMPDNLARDLADPSLKWIVFINPPFATANVAQDDIGGDKTGVSMTAVRTLMNREGLGETSRELFVQFLWRINREFAERNALLGMFSTIKYINSNNDQRLRDKIFSFQFQSGFCFPSKAFVGNKGNFPVGFVLWSLHINKPLHSQRIELDVFNLDVEKIGTKEFPSIHRENFLNQLPTRPRTASIFPPFSNAITVAEGKKDVRDRVAENFLGSLMTNGNDFAHQNNTAIFSGPYVSAGGFSITPENFEDSMFVHAARLVRKATWLNNRDQWYQPSSPVPQELLSQCVAWGLFSSTNQTASLKDVPYQGIRYQVDNHFFPFSRAQVSKWRPSNGAIEQSLAMATDERYVHKYLSSIPMQKEIEEILGVASEVYALFYSLSSRLPLAKFKAQTWDLGWYQIRNLLKELELGTIQLDELSKVQKRLGRNIDDSLEPLGVLLGKEFMFSSAEE